MSAYYNEIDPEAAQTLRNLIDMGQIAPGDVDERDIRDVRPGDLTGYSQCHFFAGIGIWSLALRNAGVPDTARVWTGSCPCQPFSAAGSRGGFLDERHLWPAWHWLIAQCRPEIVFGEQVASKDGLGWFDLVSADMEGTGYAVAAEDRCGPSVGAPHIRQRLWFGAVRLADAKRHGPQTGIPEAQGGHERDAEITGNGGDRRSRPGSRMSLNGGMEHRTGDRRIERRAESSERGATGGCGFERLADADGRNASAERQQRGGQQRQQSQDSGSCGMGDAERNLSGRMPGQASGKKAESGCVEKPGDNGPVDAGPGSCGTSASDNPWRDSDWLYCRDDKWRPVEPGTFPLAHGLPRGMGKCDAGVLGLAKMAGCDAASLKRAKRHRVVALRCYGNAIIEPVARQFIRDFHEILRESGTMRG